VLTALRQIDPHPDRRQVAMVDTDGGLDLYTGAGCVAEAGHRVREDCAALANLVASSAVWDDMVDDAEDPLGQLDVLLDRSRRYHRVVAALDLALAGRAEEACADLDRMADEDPGREPDLLMWRALTIGLAGREDAAD
jgi:uncharacterized Ntn-hydrolase superfamily protein